MEVNLNDLSTQQTGDPMAVGLRSLFASELHNSLQGLGVDSVPTPTLRRFCRRLNDTAVIYGFRSLADFVGRSEVLIMTGRMSQRHFFDLMEEVRRRIVTAP